MKFKRITKRTRFTFPCVVAYREQSTMAGWSCWIAGDQADVTNYYTHWLPFEWPGGRK